MKEKKTKKRQFRTVHVSHLSTLCNIHTHIHPIKWMPGYATQLLAIKNNYMQLRKVPILPHLHFIFMSVASKRHLRAERNCVLNVCCHPPNVKPKVLSTQLYNTQGRQHTHNPMPSAAQRHSGIYPSKAKGGKNITIHVKLGEGEAM